MLIPSEQDFAQAVALWREWNGRINVISRKDEDNIFAHHILHSLAIAQYLELFYPSASPSATGKGPVSGPQWADCTGIARPKACPEGDYSLPQVEGFGDQHASACTAEGVSEPVRTESPGAAGYVRGGAPDKTGTPQAVPTSRMEVLDVGTGGGFPGIPLAMVMPWAKFTLCDSIGKKVKVAQAVSDGLGLQNVECVNARVESLPGQWDWVVSRAVTSLENFYPWVKGRFRRSILYLKGGDIDTEIAVLRKKYHIPTANIRTWRIDSWLKDEYFAEKFVIEVGKNYLCTP